MRDRKLSLWIGVICLASCGMAVRLAFSPAAVQAQEPAASNDAGTIRAESRLVLVDTVVADKKGEYVRDLTAKEFKVWEDNKAQAITSFSFEDAISSGPNAPKRYLVLFFDNSTMDFGDQAKARDAAAKFVNANAAPNRLMAVVNFGGTVQIAQNFTADAARLQRAVSGLKSSAVNPNAQEPVELASLNAPPGLNMPTLGNAEADFGVRSVMLALRSMAKNLMAVPGRKTLIMLTAGFPLTSEFESELTAVIDACNKANVAIYPIDVRGLTAPGIDMTPPGPHGAGLTIPVSPAQPRLVPATFHYRDASSYPQLELAAFLGFAPDPQHGGGPPGGGGGGPGGGHAGGAPSGGGTSGGGGKGGTTGGGGTSGGGGKGGTSGGGTSGGGRAGGVGLNPNQYNGTQGYNDPRQIVPPFPPSSTTNQQALYALADGTGGFVIINTNDLLGGLEKIGREQSQYYVLGYVPAQSTEGSCHSLKVKVEREGTTVRARSGYCNIRPRDLLAGNPIEKTLESHASAEMPGNVTALMVAPFFYTSPNTARINLAIDIPSNSIKFEKVKGKQHSSVNVLGIAYKPDSSIAARFSDTVNFDLDGKKEVEEFQKLPFHYENQFEVASGQYKLTVVFSSGNESFGRVELPLTIDTYDGKQFTLSGLALSNDIRRASEMSTTLDAVLLEGKTPLMVQGMQLTPSASNHFKKTEKAAIYAEVYDPALKDPNPPDVAFELIIVDRKTGEQKQDVKVRNPPLQTGNPVLPIGMKLPVATLQPGLYRVDLRAFDAAGHTSKTRSAEFEVE